MRDVIIKIGRKKMNKNDQLLGMVTSRKSLFSDDEVIQKNNEDEIDKRAEEIRNFIKQYRSELSFEVIVESLTMLGAAPSLLYDDNGHFYIGGDGFQNLPTFDDSWKTKETDFQGTWFVPANGWKETIREALDAYLDS